MSTYTDLHNRLKENITIIHHPRHREDGMTPQLVKFMNPENEYYGTFFGTLKNAAGTLSSVKLNDVSIDGATITNASVNGVDLDTIGQQIQVLTSDFEDLENKFNKLCCDDFGDLKKCQNRLIECVQQSCDHMHKHIKETYCYVKGFDDALNNLQKDVNGLKTDTTLNTVSARLTGDIETKYANALTTISNVSSELAIADANVLNQLCEASCTLDTAIQDAKADVIEQLNAASSYVITSCDMLSSKLGEAVTDAKQFAMDEVASNKHYSFKSVKAQNAYKFKVDDYAINSIEILPDCAKIINVEDNTIVGAVRNVISNSGANSIVQHIVVRFFESAAEIPDELRCKDIMLERDVPYQNGVTWKPDDSFHYDDPSAIVNDTIVVNGINYMISSGDSDADILLMQVPELIANRSREFIVSFKPGKVDIVPVISIKFDDCAANSTNSRIVYLWHGEEITDNTIQIFTGKKTTIKFQEVSKNVFVVTDFDDSLLAHDVDKNREHIKALEDKVAEFSNSGNNITSTIDELKQRIDELEKTIETYEAANADLNSRIEKLEKLIDKTFDNTDDETIAAKLKLNGQSKTYKLEIDDNGMLTQTEL